MSTITEEYDTQDDSEKQNDPAEFYGVRDGTLFLIDTSSEMFNNNDDGIPLFVSCIEEYIYILKQKLVWNRQDWMGLILIGTETCDTDTKIENILTLQKLSPININKLKEAEKIRNNWKDYKSKSSSKQYPLQDTLWHAALSFSSINLTMSARRVILYTCHDVPPLTNENEKHRIRAKAATYSDSGILLYVVGLGNTWDAERFYKDLEMLSRNINKEDYQRTSYKDLLHQVKRPSRRMAKLPWRLGKDVVINVDICNVCVKSQDVKKMTMNSENNAPLVAYTYFQRKDSDTEEDEEDQERDEKITMPLLDADLRKMGEFGGEKIYFTLDEVKSFEKIFEMGIDMIGVKPFYCDPMYHLHAPYFVSCNKSCSKGEKLLFAALLDKCKKRNLIIICRVTLRKHSGSYLYNMIPMSDEGGFYLYKIPYNENVNNFTEEMYQYAFNDQDKKIPINDEGVQLFKQIIKKFSQIYDPERFPNPKLQVKLQSVETLALDLDVRDPPQDETLPMEDVLQERIGDLTKQLNELFMPEENEFNPPDKKRYKKSGKSSDKSVVTYNDEDVLELVQQNKLDRCKVSDLQLFLRNAGLITSGRKIELIDRLYTHYRKNSDEN
ncbi:X-ray repair cross-complementing protein 6-like [Vespula maculifrons]|uniref:X-ray repair cross-complementing protein 6-like n=1 Tax=Vespula maculifrons TaxID=7453 RepID=A0ABD2B449_VESMC|nr:X-ray repair cross-complementing protein 6-like [Vespula vulgaris]